MKVTTSKDLSKFPAISKQEVGTIKVPVIGLMMGIPLGFEARTEKTEIDTADIQQQYLEALEPLMPKLAAEIAKALDAALKASWSWTSGSRDIYDTGALARSGKVVANSNGIEVTYSAPYANIVHNGGYIQPYGNPNARPVYMPPRPWVSSVLYGEGPYPQFDFDGFMKANLP